MKTIAVSRIYLDNFDHITAYWIGLGVKSAQVALDYGADDLHGTIQEEKIFHMAGADSPQERTKNEMIQAIEETNRVPVQRNTFYEPLTRHGSSSQKQSSDEESNAVSPRNKKQEKAII
jgi:aminodeoxyfutalosine synthase